MPRQLRLSVVIPVVILILSGSVPTASGAAPVRRGAMTYFFDNPHYIAGADSSLAEVRTRLQSLLRDDLDFQADVFLVDSETRFDSLVGEQFPDWGAAAAIPSANRIVVKSPDSFRLNRPLAELLRHEYAHLALAHRTATGSAPRWFDEGFAMVASMEWSWSHNLTMNLAAVTGNLLPLREISRVNRFGQGKARLAYAQSYLTVQYLFKVYGIDGVNLFLDEIGAGRSLDQALLAATGSNYDDFEREIHVYLQSKFNLIGLVADTMYFWLALAVIVVIGFFLSLRRRRQYYRRWEEAERLESTDFDYGDPDQPEQSDDDEPWRQ